MQASFAGIDLTHPDRVLYPQQGVTKFDLACYFDTMSEPLLEHVADRLVSLVRCPRGREAKCFFQRHGGSGLPEEFRRKSVRGKDGDSHDYLYFTQKKALIAAAQLGVLELHVWGSKVDDIERPDRLVFDLDPDEGLAFGKVKEAATLMRAVLREFDLESFPLLTGGKGIHVVAPLVRRHEWPVVKAFAGELAGHIAREDPGNYVATMSKARRKGRIFIDYLRNERGSTAIAPFSPRAREGAPVAWPVSWEALETVKAPDQFRLKTADPAAANGWDGYGRLRQSLKASGLRALGIDV